MSNYIVLSNRPWNSNLSDQLSIDHPESNWHYITSRENFTLEKIAVIDPDYIFIPHWSFIIPSAIHDKYTCIVFHMTDLPYGRGGSPLQNLIDKGHLSTKISALRVTSGIDEGPVYLKKNLSLLGTAEEIFIRANHIIRKMINEFVETNLEPSDQKGEVTKFKRRTPEQGCLNKLNELDKVYDYIRMLDAEGYPAAYFKIDNFKLEFSRASLKANKSIIADVRITKE